jgi:hypothetical protein
MPNTPGLDAARELEAARALGHQPHRFNVQGVVACGFALAFLGLVVHVVITGFVAVLEGPRPETKPSAMTRPVLPQDLAKIRKPVLQAVNDEDMIALREKEKALLTEYRWVDRDKGIVRIPIARAMELLAKEKGR